ncbi:MAG: hypothetical protein ACR2ME_04335 [Acidimicrobiia bacterium]
MTARKLLSQSFERLGDFGVALTDNTIGNALQPFFLFAKPTSSAQVWPCDDPTRLRMESNPGGMNFDQSSSSQD